MTALVLVSGLVLGAAALLVTVRIVRGPTMLDRAISFDVIVALSIAAIALDAIARRTAESLPLMLVATLLGFVGSVSVARFSPGSDVVDGEADPDSDAGSDDSGSAGEER